MPWIIDTRQVIIIYNWFHLKNNHRKNYFTVNPKCFHTLIDKLNTFTDLLYNYAWFNASTPWTCTPHMPPTTAFLHLFLHTTVAYIECSAELRRVRDKGGQLPLVQGTLLTDWLIMDAILSCGLNRRQEPTETHSSTGSIYGFWDEISKVICHRKTQEIWFTLEEDDNPGSSLDMTQIED